MPPDGAYVSAFNVTRLRVTASRHSPSYAQRLVHSLHHFVVRSTASNASNDGGGFWCDSYHVSENGTRSPAPTVNCATVVHPLPCVCTGERNTSASGPPIARSPPSTRSTHGTTEP